MSVGVVKVFQKLMSCSSGDWSGSRIEVIDPGEIVVVGVVATGAETGLVAIVSGATGERTGTGGFLSK